MKPNRQRAEELYKKLLNGGDGLTYQVLLEYILNDYMDGQQALDALQSAEQEFYLNDMETYRSTIDWEDSDYDDETDED